MSDIKKKINVREMKSVIGFKRIKKPGLKKKKKKKVLLGPPVVLSQDLGSNN